MSLRFDRALREFDASGAALVAFDGEPAADDDRSPTPDLDRVVRLASNRRGALSRPDVDWLCVPLHGPESAALSGEYVGFEDHPVRGEVFVYRDAEGSDEPTAVAVDATDGTELARRLRFWTPGTEPDEPAPYAGDGPSDRVSPRDPVPEGDREGYFDRLAGFVADEREAEREENRERAERHTPRELFERGETAVPAVRGFAALADGRLQCHADADGGTDVRRRYGVYEGDEVLVHTPGGGQRDADGPVPERADSPVEFPFAATVARVTERTLDLAPRPDLGDAEAVAAALNEGGGTGLSGLLNPTTYDREAAAVERVREDPDARALVAGGRRVGFEHETAVETRRRDRDLDGSQSLAAVAACYAEDLCCVHGPPGTGKTRVLVEAVRRAAAAGERVLVCADSNQGVDNLLVGESAEGDVDESSLHYFGRHAEEFTLDRHHERHSDRELVRDAYRDDPRRPDVVATTNSSAADYPDGAFDLAVVDEATQATTPSTFVPLTKADRIVLAGDHRQLPPYSATEAPADDERDRSLFEHCYADDGVYGPAVGVALRTQYRMHPEIAAFPNEAFYDGRLRNGAAVSPVEGFPPVLGVDVDGEEREDEAGSYANPAEARAVRALVDRLLDAGVAGHEVGVVAPYRAQTGAVASELGELSAAGADEVTVDTVDSFQGGEREAVVVTFARSNDRGDVGFLGRAEDGPRRLNVALTRAERFCGLVGDWDTLRDGGDGRNACADLYRDLFDRLRDADRTRSGDAVVGRL
ncbi:MAG: DEAD/DEAH box helicase [Halosimplex sp.]